MHKWITLLMTLCASYSVASESCFQFEAGYRQDTINWNVQTPARHPAVKVSSKYENIDIFQLGVKGRTNLGCNFYGRASFDIGWVLDGDHKDRTRLFIIPGDEAFADDITVDGSVSFGNRNVLDGRFVLDADLAFGYPFYFCDCQAYIAPVVGYGFNEQYLTDDENRGFDFNEEFLFDPSCGGCCTSKFISKWYGPFIGIDFAYDTCSCFKTYGAFEYHWVGQKTKRHGFAGFSDLNGWNHHYNNARGFVFNLGFVYDFCHCWGVGLDFQYRDFVAHRRTRISSFEIGEVIEAFSNNEDCGCSDKAKSTTKWRSFAISLTLDRVF